MCHKCNHPMDQREDLHAAYPPDLPRYTKDQELVRSAELYVEIANRKDNGPLFALHFLLDSGYGREDLEKIVSLIKYVKPNPEPAIPPAEWESLTAHEEAERRIIPDLRSDIAVLENSVAVKQRALDYAASAIFDRDERIKTLESRIQRLVDENAGYFERIGQLESGLRDAINIFGEYADDWEDDSEGLFILTEITNLLDQ